MKRPFIQALAAANEALVARNRAAVQTLAEQQGRNLVSIAGRPRSGLFFRADRIPAGAIKLLGATKEIH